MSDEGFKFEGTGTFERVETTATKAGKDMHAMIVSFTDGKYPQIASFKLWGRTIEEAKQIAPGSTIKVSGYIGGRDWNGRIYNDVKAARIEVIKAAERQAELPMEDPDLVPF